MWQKFLEFLRGLFMNKNDVTKVIGGADVVVSDLMNSAIVLWKSMYDNNPPWVNTKIKTMGLAASLLRQNFHQLSGGQKQRVIIARALCSKPDLIVFDEPLNGVDFETKLKIYDLLSALNKTDKVTILFVSHEVDHIIDKCHHILCLNKTMHTGCHPLDFAKGKGATDCPVLSLAPQVVPVHHTHDNKSSCSC